MLEGAADAARSVPIEDELARRGIYLNGHGPERSGTCPRCGSTIDPPGHDRFNINTTDQVFLCRKCGAGGRGSIDLVMFLDQCDFKTAVETLSGKSLQNGNGHNSAREERAVLDQTYDYVDENGTLLYQIRRFVYEWPDGSPVKSNGKRKKDFFPRRPDKNWRWIKGRGCMDGVRRVPYKLPELHEAIAAERLIFFTEGEAKVNALNQWGIPATCIAGGSKSPWNPSYSEHFKEADIVILPDNDDPGRKAANTWASHLTQVAKRVRILELPDVPPAGDIVDWKANGGTPQRLFELVEQAAAPFETEPYKSKFGAIVWGEPRPASLKYEHAVKGIIPRREPVMIYGFTQSGKSFFALDVAMHIARGITYCGRPVKRGGIIYCAAEAGVGFYDLRMRAYSQYHGISLGEPLPFACFTRKFDLFGPSADDQVAQLITDCKYYAERFADRHSVELEAVVIDTLNKVTPAMDEIFGKDVSAVMFRMDRICRELNTGLWLVHHKNAAGTGPRGHTSLLAGFETAIEVKRGKEMIEFPPGSRMQRESRYAVLQKQREGEDGISWKFVLEKVWLDERDENGDRRSSCVVALVDPEVPADKRQRKGNILSAWNLVCFRALREALGEFGVPPPAELRLPLSVHLVVEKRFWLDVFRKKAFESKENTVIQYMRRAHADLLGKGIIAVNDPYVWIVGQVEEIEP